MNKILFHTIDQPKSDITAFILSCNRLHLLNSTVESFLQTRDLETKIVIVDDSGNSSVFDTLVEKYGHISDIVCFPRNRGLWWAKDFMTSFCDTPYIFYIEDDWLFLNTGYLSKSKQILEKYREIGSIDLSWRTFEEEGFDSYYQEIQDNEFFYKKPWQISEHHLHWFCWHGSPNLKRREDLILLGRVESFYNEWNVDRKFYALGLRGVFLKDRYVMHTGDNDSIMVNKRPREDATPELLYPEELIPNKIFPSFDYFQMGQLANELIKKSDKKHHSLCLVTSLLDIDRADHDGRDFNYYLSGLNNLIELDLPLVIFADSRHYHYIMSKTGGRPICVIPIDINTIRSQPYYEKIKEICESEGWINQSEWMKTSIIKSPDYLALTINKMQFMMDCVKYQLFKCNKYYWIDSGICNSFQINSLKAYNLKKALDTKSILMTYFPYHIETEMHGYNKQGFLEICKYIPDFVCRATIFGGTKGYIEATYNKFSEILSKSLDMGYIGTEESIFSIMAITNPELFLFKKMSSGDIKNFLEEYKNE